jgi:hypothetical protein
VRTDKTAAQMGAFGDVLALTLDELAQSVKINAALPRPP